MKALSHESIITLNQIGRTIKTLDQLSIILKLNSNHIEIIETAILRNRLFDILILNGYCLQTNTYRVIKSKGIGFNKLKSFNMRSRNLITAFGEVINTLPDKGLSENEFQKVCLLNVVGKLELCVNGVEDSEVINTLPDKGLSENEFQKVCLLNVVGKLELCVNGVEDSDFVE